MTQLGFAFTAPATSRAPALDVRPNKHGVYSHDQAERLTLPCLRKNWQGCPTARIDLLHTGQGWLCAYDYQTETAGGCSPLSAAWDGFLPDRAAALQLARDQLQRRLKGLTDKSAARIRAWLPTLL
jgi:hypothetical protein